LDFIFSYLYSILCLIFCIFSKISCFFFIFSYSSLFRCSCCSCFYFYSLRFFSSNFFYYNLRFWSLIFSWNYLFFSTNYFGSDSFTFLPVSLLTTWLAVAKSYYCIDCIDLLRNYSFFYKDYFYFLAWLSFFSLIWWSYNSSGVSLVLLFSSNPTLISPLDILPTYFSLICFNTGFVTGSTYFICSFFSGEIISCAFNGYDIIWVLQ